MDEISSAQTRTPLWLSYALNREITPALRRQFTKHFADPNDLIQLLESANPSLNTDDLKFNQAASCALRTGHTHSVDAQIERACAWRKQNPKHHIIGLDHPAYPQLLLATNNAPPVLYVNGSLACLTTPCIALVGSRKASHNALELAHQIAQELSQSGITVVSGLALGVDSAAHRGALHGGGSTIAVAATGPEFRGFYST